MTSIDEKRVFDGKSGSAEALVATETGLVRVEVSADRIGGFGIAHRCTARAVASDRRTVEGTEASPAADTPDTELADRRGPVALATDVDVLVAAGGAFEAAGYGPGVAVGFHDRHVVVGDDEGNVVRRDRVEDGGDGGGTGTGNAGDDGADADAEHAWTELGNVDTVRSVDGDLVASPSGVYRIDGDGLAEVGLDDAHDVSAAGAGAPLAATADGLYSLGNGWMEEFTGDVRAVAGDGDRAVAVGTEGLYDRADGEWTESDPPTDEVVVDVAVAAGVAYAVTDRGEFLVEAGEGWQSQSLGLTGIAGVAVR
jgi:hypothetical protein